MSERKAFEYPPGWGNAVALVAYYAIFLGAQFVLGFFYLRRWNWPIFLGVVIFLFLEVLESVAYLKMSSAPFTGSWYSLWIFTLTAAPTFYISSLHFCMQRLLQNTPSLLATHTSLRFSPQRYIIVCLGIDFLTLVLTSIGAGIVGARSSQSTASSMPGYNVLTAAMCIQLCSLVIMLAVGFEVTMAFKRKPNKVTTSTRSVAATVDTVEKDSSLVEPNQPLVEPGFQRTRWFLTFLYTLLFVETIVFTRTIVCAIDVAGGIDGPLSLPVLPNVENILLFVAILFYTALHPAIHLRLKC